jgi:hypothetical protein
MSTQARASRAKSWGWEPGDPQWVHVPPKDPQAQGEPKPPREPSTPLDAGSHNPVVGCPKDEE